MCVDGGEGGEPLASSLGADWKSQYSIAEESED